MNESTDTLDVLDGRNESEPSGALSACFEYIGRTALVLTGPYTGNRYWFRQPGARLRVDGRDRHAFQAVPVLRSIAA
ncbi:MAG: hypothetical protein AB7O66_03540 [Limisphaerales bacterium]